ncbi:MAG: hypothetical protein WA724_03445 [Candidatus Dormiibacterota bacterium]
MALTGDSRVRADRILGAAAESRARLTELANRWGDIFGPLGETLFWIVALDDTLNETSGIAYRGPRDADPAGQLIPGLRYARNKVAHGVDVTTVSDRYGGAVLGLMQLGVGRLGDPAEHRWKAGLPPSGRDHKDQNDAYDAHLAQRGILPTIDAALDYIRRQV